MSILAIDTTKKSAKIATFLNGEYSTFVSPKNTSHSESLLTSLDKILKDKKTAIDEIETFGIVVGPGSFTGIRIGASLIKAFMFGKDKKSVAVNSFDLIAYNINSINLSSNFVIALNADNRGSYVAEYNSQKELVNIKVMSLNNLENYLKLNKINFNILKEDKEFFDKVDYKKSVITLKENTLIELIEKKANHNNFTSIYELEPLYIKLSQAEDQYKQKMLKELKIEKANIKDLDELNSLEIETFGNEAFSEASLKEELTFNNRHYLVAKLDKKIIGYIGAWETENQFNILKVAVHKLYKKLGVATRLFEELDKVSESLKISEMFLEVKENNKPAIAFYKKLGFKEKYKREKYYKDGKSAIVMFLNK